MASFFQNALEAGPCILQAALERTGADVECAGDVLDVRATASEFLLYLFAHRFGEIFFPVLLLQLFVELRRKHGQKFGVAGNELALCISGTKHDGVASGSAHHRTAEVTLNGLRMRSEVP